MTTPSEEQQSACPAEALLKALAGKWKAQIFRLALDGPLRFNSLLRQLPGASKQSVNLALREMEALGLLERKEIRQKPLHVEYTLTTHGRALVPVFLSLEKLSG